MPEPREVGSMTVKLDADCAEFEATIDRLTVKMRTLADEAERAASALRRNPANLDH